MKKQILTINAQSFVDVITNSSSELFICNTDKSIDLVNEILQELLNGYVERNGGGPSFSDCFGAIAIVGDNNQTGTYFIDDLPLTEQDALEERRKEIIKAQIIRELEKDPSWDKKNWQERDKISVKKTEAQFLEYKREEKLATVTSEKSNLPEWWFTGAMPKKNSWDYDSPMRWRGMYKGKIIIESATDNSIPYDLFDEIESAFNAERHHMG
jgi:hypothetical protein